MSSLARSRKAAAPKHKSIQALLAAYPEHSDPKALIRILAREKVAVAKKKGWLGPPFCPKIFTSLFGLRCKEVDHDIDGDGRILLYPDGRLWIEYRSGRLPERQRFTIFHEFAHTLFPDYAEFLPRHHQASQKRVPDPDREFEYLCDVGASEMLLPIDDFRNHLAEFPSHGFEAIHELSGRYRASIDATTYRLVEVVEHSPCAVAFLTDQRDGRFGPGPLWVKSFSANPCFKSFIWPDTTPPPNSVVVECYHNNSVMTKAARETWWIKGQPHTWLVQATKLPIIPDHPEYAKVAALLFS
jgi:hypothetical protein